MMAGRLRSMLTTGGAAALSQAMVLATTPIASRLFDDAAFGVLGLLVAISNILSILGHFGYSEAVIAAEDDGQADLLVVGVAAICMITAIPVAVLTFLAVDYDVLGYGDLPTWCIPLVAVEVVAITLVGVLQLRAIRGQAFGVLAASHITLGAARAGGQVGIGLMLPNAAGLVLSEVVSRCATAAMMIFKSPARLLLPPYDFAGVWIVLRQLASFAWLRSASIFLNTVSVALPTLIVSQHFSLAEIGALSFALAVLYAPLGFVQKAVGDVFTGHYLALLQSDRAAARHAIVQVFWALFGLGALIWVVLYFAAVPIFTFVFGSQWALAGQTAAELAPLIALMTVTIPLSTSLNILRKAGIALWFNGLRLVGLLLGFLVVPYLELDFLQTVVWISLSQCLAYAIYGVLIFQANATALREP